MNKKFYEEMYDLYKEVLYSNCEYEGAPISHCSFTYNIEKWEKNKKGLIDKLSKHPYYYDDQFCIIKPIEIIRDSDYEGAKNAINILIDRFYNVDFSNRLVKLIVDSLRNIKETYDHYAFDEDISWGDKKDEAEVVFKSQDINKLINLCEKCFWEKIVCENILFRFLKYRPEQHIGKLFDKILGLLDSCKTCDKVYSGSVSSLSGALGRPKVDIFGREYYTFTQVHDMIKDIIIPKKFNKYIVISCHPIDYLTQSHLKSGSSCHSLRDDGCYHGATLTSMTDPSTLICYLLNDTDIVLDGSDLTYMHTVDKVSRVLCNYGNGLLIVNQMYPKKYGDERSQIIALLKYVLADCDESFEWEKLEMTYNTYEDYVDYSEFKGYNDYMNGKKALFLLNKDEHDSNRKLILGLNAKAIDDDDYWVGEPDEGKLTAQYSDDEYYDEDEDY